MLSDEFTDDEKGRTLIEGYKLDIIQLAVNLGEEAIFDFSTFENIYT